MSYCTILRVFVLPSAEFLVYYADHPDYKICSRGNLQCYGMRHQRSPSFILSISAVSVVLLDHSLQKFRFRSETAIYPDLQGSACNFKVYNSPFLIPFRKLIRCC